MSESAPRGRHMGRPQVLADACNASLERMTWLERVPEAVHRLADEWSLDIRIDEPFESSASWVAPAKRADGSRVVLKLGMPHMEAEQEIQGLRYWEGDPTVILLESDASLNAMLLERCDPGTSLREFPEHEQDQVIAAMLRRIWRPLPGSDVFRPLALMIRHWCAETERAAAQWPDSALVRDGLSVFAELAAGTGDTALLATDLHAGNVLRAERQPWLVIDPKPFLGDRAYDATQHLLNCRNRLRTDMDAVIRRVASLLDLDVVRVRLWLFARLAAEPREIWDAESLTLARSIAP